MSLQFKKLGLVYLIITFNCHGNIYKTPWQFSDDFVKNNAVTETENKESTHPLHTWMYNTDCATVDFLQEPMPNQPQSKPWLTVENAHKVINIATLTYVCIKIYNRYHEVYTLPVAQNSSLMVGTLKQIVNSICPQFIQTIGTHGCFLIDSVEIAFKGLIYKTVAQLIVLCGSGNIVDFMACGLQKAAHLVL